MFRQLIGKQITCNYNGNDDQIIWQSIEFLHNIGPTHIILSSISVAKSNSKETTLQMYASAKNSNDQFQTFRIDFPYLEGCFTGTGDTFSALILAWLYKDNNLIVSLFNSDLSFFYFF